MDKIKVEIKQNGLDLDIDKQAFALQLKTWRLRHEYTQKKAGEILGCSRFVILRAEKAQPVTWESAYRLFARLSKELQREAVEDIKREAGLQANLQPINL